MEPVLPVQQASKALADGFSNLSRLLTTLDEGLAECAAVLSECETALVGVSRGAALPAGVLQEQAASAKATQLLISKLRATLSENQRGVAKAIEAIPANSKPTQR